MIAQYGADGGRALDWSPSYNIAPTQQVPVVRELEGQRVLELVRWGMVPPSSPTFGGGKPIINARVETVATNGLFKGAFASRRCLVPAAGYYEWQLQEHGKQPFFIHEPGAEIAMAGILRGWEDKDADPESPERWRMSMAIITRDAHVAPGEIHDRMPGLLTAEGFDDWLGDGLDAGDLLGLLDATSMEVAHRLEYFAVSKAVNSVRNNGPELLQPV